MNLFITTFESVAVLLGIGLVGFWIIRRHIIPVNILGLLSPLALDIALPSLIFVNIIQGFNPSSFPDWWQLPLWWVFFTLIAGGLTFLFMFISKKENRREFGLSLFYQNGIFFPLAILAGMFGNDSSYLVFLFIFAIFYPAFFFSTSHLFFKKESKSNINWKRVIHPVLIVTILAVLIKISGFHTFIPSFVVNIFSLLGGMTVPLIMLILGGNIYVDFRKKGQLQIIEILKFVIVKNIIFPIIFIGLLLFIHPVYEIALLLLLQSAVPPVTAVPLVAERFGGNRSIVNQFIFSSFISSLVTIPIMVMIFSNYFL